MLQLDLTTKHDTNNKIDVFKADPLYEQHEAEWAAIRKELLGDEDEEEGDGDDGGSDDDDDEDDDDADEAQPSKATVVRFYVTGCVLELHAMVCQEGCQVPS